MSTEPNQTSNDSSCMIRRQGVRDKLHAREGNNPDSQLRALIRCLVRKDVQLHRQPGSWLRSSHDLKSA